MNVRAEIIRDGWWWKVRIVEPIVLVTGLKPFHVSVESWSRLTLRGARRSARRALRRRQQREQWQREKEVIEGSPSIPPPADD